MTITEMSSVPGETEIPEDFTCPKCGLRNQEPDDVAEGYCQRCKTYTGEPVYQIVPPRTWVPLRGSNNLVRHDQDRPVKLTVRYLY